MYQLNPLDDTIVAISTAVGQGGIGIIRISGKDSVKIADELFTSKNKKKISAAKNFTVHYGWIVKKETSQESGQAIVDEVLMTVMRGPKSYTREDIVEINCHGGVVSLKTILNLAIDLGARLADPGEFTKRAFLNGRIDLTQAEAVLDIIQAKTHAFLKISLNQLKGELSVELETIRDTLMKIYTELEAIINFPEDEIDASGKSKLIQNTASVLARVSKLLESSERGKILKDGIKIVLCGRPNVGKSSLLNALLKEPRAIVTEIAGTTRDPIEETAQIRGIPFQLVDTAGILEPRDLVEEEAIRRSHIYLDQANLVLLVMDGNSVITEDDKALIEKIKTKNVVAVINKIDLEEKEIEGDLAALLGGEKKIIKVSALKGTAISDLEDAIVDMVWKGRMVEVHGALLSNVRQINSLRDCQKSLEKVLQLFRENYSWEFLSEEIKLAINYLDQITGRNIDADLLDKIFSEFCIGK